jgi:hypothetical protein
MGGRKLTAPSAEEEAKKEIFNPQHRMLELQIAFRGLTDLTRNNDNWTEEQALEYLHDLQWAVAIFAKGLRNRIKERIEKPFPSRDGRHKDQMLQGAFLSRAG